MVKKKAPAKSKKWNQSIGTLGATGSLSARVKPGGTLSRSMGRQAARGTHDYAPSETFAMKDH